MGDHVTTTILTKGKEGRSEDLSAIFAMGDHGPSQHFTRLGLGGATDSCGFSPIQVAPQSTPTQGFYLPVTALSHL